MMRGRFSRPRRPVASGILAGQVTGIGSLPHRDPVAALDFIAEWSPVIPFWSQLPQRSVEESMIAQLLAPVRDLLERHGPARFTIAPGQLEALLQRLQEHEACFDAAGALVSRSPIALPSVAAINPRSLMPVRLIEASLVMSTSSLRGCVVSGDYAVEGPDSSGSCVR